VLGVHTCDIGEHCAERSGDGDRIAMGLDDLHVGKHLEQRSELLEVLRRLEHPASAAT